MSAKLFLTIAAVRRESCTGWRLCSIPIADRSRVYGVPADPHTRPRPHSFSASALIWAWRRVLVRQGFSRLGRRVSGVLIASVVGCIVGGGVNLLGTFQGLLNGMAWSSTVIYALLLVGALYCLSAGTRSERARGQAGAMTG